MIAVTLGLLGFMALADPRPTTTGSTCGDRPDCTRLIAVPIGFVLAVVAINISSLDVNALFWLLLYAVALIPGGLAYAMLRARHGAAALWPAVLAFLVAVSALLVSAVQLS